MNVVPSSVLAKRLKPLCPRDAHTMKYQSAESQSNLGFEPSYHCGYQGCSVRYNSISGYFALSGARNHTYLVTEPGANTLQCPIHQQWLYRSSDPSSPNSAPLLRCGVQGCSYIHNSQAAPTTSETSGLSAARS